MMRRSSPMIFLSLVALVGCDVEPLESSDATAEVVPPEVDALGASPRASLDAPSEACPDAARYATNGAGQAFCLFEDLELPDAELDAYCTYLAYGYIGFSWAESPATAGYTCPEGSYYGPNGAGTGYCVFDDLGLPDASGLDAYCYYLDDGYIGYSWDLCPAGTRYAPNGAGAGYCLWEDVALPEAEDLSPYCTYVDDGYLGFSWTDGPATAGYSCPSGSRQTDNGAGLNFCLFEDVWLPADDVQPYCNYLDDGYFGFSWTL